MKVESGRAKKLTGYLDVSLQKLRGIYDTFVQQGTVITHLKQKETSLSLKDSNFLATTVLPVGNLMDKPLEINPNQPIAYNHILLIKEIAEIAPCGSIHDLGLTDLIIMLLSLPSTRILFLTTMLKHSRSYKIKSIYLPHGPTTFSS